MNHMIINIASITDITIYDARYPILTSYILGQNSVSKTSACCVFFGQ